MYSLKHAIFGPNSLIEYIKYKNWVWVRVRKSYRLLQFTQRELEKFLREPVNRYTSQRAEQFFRDIIRHWTTIDVAKRAFKSTLHRYRLTAPSDLEMALYGEYLLLGDMIRESCIANLAKAGFIYPKSKRVDDNFV